MSSTQLTESTEAYHLYLIGRNYLAKRTEESITKTMDYFKKAIEIDSKKAYEDRDWHVRILKEEPFFNALRSEPRYIELLNRLGLPH